GLRLFQASPDVFGVDSGGRKHRAEPEQRDDAQGEEQLLAQVRRTERPGNRGQHGPSCAPERRYRSAMVRGWPIIGISVIELVRHEHPPRKLRAGKPKTPQGIIRCPANSNALWAREPITSLPRPHERHSSVIVPPAAVIFSLADAENA